MSQVFFLNQLLFVRIGDYEVDLRIAALEHI